MKVHGSFPAWGLSTSGSFQAWWAISHPPKSLPLYFQVVEMPHSKLLASSAGVERHPLKLAPRQGPQSRGVLNMMLPKVPLAQKKSKWCPELGVSDFRRRGNRASRWLEPVPSAFDVVGLRGLGTSGLGSTSPSLPQEMCKVEDVL